MKIQKEKIIYLCLFTILIFLYYSTFIMADSTLISRTKGRILLQVEENGEAWYVDPFSEERHFLGRPDDAFDLMRRFGLGVTNQNLKKIAIAETSFEGFDTDQDGLSDLLEDALGSDKNSPDSDEDSYSDLEELKNGYDPTNNERLEIDEDFASAQAGRILIQAEQNGEAWYINPIDKKRYFLGRPQDAFTVMRKTGLGISNENIEKIAIWQEDYQPIDAKPTENGTELVYKTTSYSIKYPSTWKSNKISGKAGEVIAIRNYQKNIIEEKKAMITIAHIKKEEGIELDRFRIASKEGTRKDSSENMEINKQQVLKEVFSSTEIDAKETNTYVKLSDNDMLMLTLFSAGNHDQHSKVFQEILSSIQYLK